MKRIFLTLAVLSTLLLLATFFLGINVEIGDARTLDNAQRTAIRSHVLTALAGLVFAMMVHALVLTYFMGTGRWLEETCRAYRLPDSFRGENQSLKYRTMPAMVGCLILLIATGALGAAVDPGSSVRFNGWGSLDGPTVHFLAAAVALAANAAVNMLEYFSIARNAEVVDAVLTEVHRIRRQKGLPVSS